MNQVLANALPRPCIDPAFSVKLLAQVLDSRDRLISLPIPEPAGRKRLYVVSGAVAAALALGAAIGRRHIRPRSDDAA